MAQPFISVIINNYNYARFVGAAIESALAQTYPHKEIIVVDDGSTDESRTVIQQYTDRVKIVFKENGGQASAFHAGVAAAQGEVICFLDADDYWAPQVLERVAARWDDTVAIVEWRVECVDSAGKPIGRTLPLKRPAEGDLRPVLLRRVYYPWTPTSGNAFARRALEAVLPLDETLWRISADLPLLLAVPFYGNLAFIDETLTYYRVHGANLYHGIKPCWNRLQREVRHGLAREAIIREHAQRQGLRVHPRLGYSLPTLNLMRLMLLLGRRAIPEMRHDTLLKLIFYGIWSVWEYDVPWTARQRLSWMPPYLLAMWRPRKALEKAARLIFWGAHNAEIAQFLHESD
jgi:glycosyltransferase involved in cell wall biosynthesis